MTMPEAEGESEKEDDDATDITNTGTGKCSKASEKNKGAGLGGASDRGGNTERRRSLPYMKIIHNQKSTKHISVPQVLFTRVIHAFPRRDYPGFIEIKDCGVGGKAITCRSSTKYCRQK